jgi:hypothetical protein
MMAITTNNSTSVKPFRRERRKARGGRVRSAIVRTLLSLILEIERSLPAPDCARPPSRRFLPWAPLARRRPIALSLLHGRLARGRCGRPRRSSTRAPRGNVGTSPAVRPRRFMMSREPRESNDPQRSILTNSRTAPWNTMDPSAVHEPPLAARLRLLSPRGAAAPVHGRRKGE